MIALQRLLKKNILTSLLDRAAAIFGPGWQVTLCQSPEIDGDRCCCTPLTHDGEVLGYLAISPPAGVVLDAAERTRLPALIGFVVESLKTIIADAVAKRSLAQETLGKYREIALLHRATLGLNGSLRPRDVAQALLAECHRGELPAQSGMVFLRSMSSDTFAPACFFGEVSGARLAAIADSTLFLDIARTPQGVLVYDLGGDRRWHAEADLSSLLLSPLVASNRCVGMLALSGQPGVRFEANHLQYVGTLATVAGIALGNALHFEAIQTLINSLMQALATAIDARDPFTAGHSQRVARLGVALAKAVHQDSETFPDVRYTPGDLKEVLYAGLLHDVGKIGIREEVLTKATRLPQGTMEVIAQRMALEALMTDRDNAAEYQALLRINAVDVISPQDAALVTAIGARSVIVGTTPLPLLSAREMTCLLIPRGNLTAEERREIERHPAESHRILRHIPFPQDMKRLLTIISQHHERLDGSGYPGGILDAEILLQSRIIAIVDIYDAITMARHYKPALPREKALGILWKEARGGRIDARLVTLLEKHIDTIERDCERLDGGNVDLAEYLDQEISPRTVSD